MAVSDQSDELAQRDVILGAVETSDPWLDARCYRLFRLMQICAPSLYVWYMLVAVSAPAPLIWGLMALTLVVNLIVMRLRYVPITYAQVIEDIRAWDTRPRRMLSPRGLACWAVGFAIVLFLCRVVPSITSVAATVLHGAIAVVWLGCFHLYHLPGMWSPAKYAEITNSKEAETLNERALYYLHAPGFWVGVITPLRWYIMLSLFGFMAYAAIVIIGPFSVSAVGLSYAFISLLFVMFSQCLSIVVAYWRYRLVANEIIRISNK